MRMKVLSLNCQKGRSASLKDFLHHTLAAEEYDFLLLQEVSENVLAFLEASPYGLIRRFNEELGQASELCIAYRKQCSFKRVGFKSFASMRKDPLRGFKHPCFGILWADFEIDKKIWRMAAIHLHSGLDRNIRIAELQQAKKILLADISGPAILAGDFNTGLPYERMRMARALAPELAWVTKDLDPTLDSRYTENVAHLPNRIAALLGIFNIGIKLRTDQAFVYWGPEAGHTVQCRVLPDRVSDHSPVEIIIR